VLRQLLPNPRFYGWAIVGLSFLASALSSPGQSFAISLYIDVLIDSLDVSRLEISSLYGAMTLLAAFCLPYVGNLADRTSARGFFVGNLVLLAGAIAFFATAQNLLMVAIAFFLLRLLGQGAVGLGTLTAIVLWFKRYRGRALAMSGLGYAFGELVFPATIVALFGLVGWRGSLWTFALIYLVVFAPIFALFVRERRDDEPLDGGLNGMPASTVELPDADFTLQSALRTPVFWGLLGTVAVLPMVVTALVFHQVALFKSTGWGFEMVPLSFTFFALSSVGTMYATGLILERIPSRFGITIAMLVATVSLALPAFFDSAGASLVYGMLLGGASGMMASANSLVWPEYFGVRALGAIKGVVNGVRNGATAAGPPLVALLLNSEEDFSAALLILALFCGCSALAAPFMRPPTQPHV